MDSSEFIGLTKRTAQDKAEAKNAIFRLIRIDDRAFFDYPLPDDVRTDRVCVEIENGAVVKAAVQ